MRPQPGDFGGILAARFRGGVDALRAPKRNWFTPETGRIERFLHRPAEP
jgi:hypothetical protein